MNHKIKVALKHTMEQRHTYTHSLRRHLMEICL